MELESLDDYELALRHAEHVRSIGLTDVPGVGSLLEAVDRRRHQLVARLGGHLEPRHRAKQRWKRWDAARPSATVGVDETGLSKGNDANYPFFAAGGVVVRGRDFEQVAEAVRRWQVTYTGSVQFVHEPDVRRGSGCLHLGGDRLRQEEAKDALEWLLADLPFSLVVVIIDKRRFGAWYPDGQVDGMLPGRM